MAIKKTIAEESLESNSYDHFLIYGEIDDDTSKEVATFIMEKNLSKNKPECLKLLINSYGGTVDSALSLIDVIRASKIPIYIYGVGKLWSAGLMVFMAGHRGKRFITKNTSIMSHQFTISDNNGKYDELVSYGKELGYIEQRVLSLYKSCTKLSLPTIKTKLLPATDVWITAAEAVKYGIADEVCDILPLYKL